MKHNYGHGRHHLWQALALLMLVAFQLDQLQTLHAGTRVACAKSLSLETTDALAVKRRMLLEWERDP